MPPASQQITIIEPRRGLVSFNLPELWRYRELLVMLALRDIKVRYKQTVLGATWAVLQPVMTMVVFSFFFGRLAKMPSDGLPYPIFVFAALLPWQLFAFALTQASNSVLENQALITKVYFPRLIIPLSSILAGLADFAIAMVILLLMMLYYGITPTWTLLTIPLFAFLAVLSALAVGMWLAALNSLYRDFRYTVPFLTQVWMFASPIAYPSSLVPEQWRWLYGLNPMAGVIEGFRWALLQTNNPPWLMILVSSVVVVLFLVSGIAYFRRMERTFADWV